MTPVHDHAAAPPAYPGPVVLPAAPGGEPAGAARLAAECRELAAEAELAGRRCAAVFADLSGRWHGDGSTALRSAEAAVAADTAALCRGLRQLADRLDDYARRLQHAHEHHHWSIGRLIAVGAVVAVGAAAVVVTVGAAAPVGSLAAAEVGAAIGAAEAAAAAAGAAEVELAGAVAEVRMLLAAVRALRAARPAVAGPVGQGALSAAADGLDQLRPGGRFDAGELGAAFLLGTASAAATGSGAALTRRALGRTRPPALRPITDAAGAGLAQAGVEAAREGAAGEVDPRGVAWAGLSAGAWTGLLGGLPGWLGGPVRRWAAPRRGRAGWTGPRGQPLDEILAGRVRLDRHEGGVRAGHTLRRHVGKRVRSLAERAERERRPVVSSFFGSGAAESAIGHLLRSNADDVRAYLAGAPGRSGPMFLRGEAPTAPGYVRYADGRRELSRIVCLKVTGRGDRLVILTAYLDPPRPRPGTECATDVPRRPADAVHR